MNIDVEQSIKISKRARALGFSLGVIGLLSAFGMNLRKRIDEIAYGDRLDHIDGAELMMKTEMNSRNQVSQMTQSKVEARRDWEKRCPTEFRRFRNSVSRMARASEMRSPALRGHFLREFGQSDRLVVENAAHAASVPQALHLLNGSMTNAIGSRFSPFGKQLHLAKKPEEKIRLIFQGMLTREPTTSEIELGVAEFDRHEDDAVETLIWTLLNTQQFLFVQ